MISGKTAATNQPNIYLVARRFSPIACEGMIVGTTNASAVAASEFLRNNLRFIFRYDLI